MMGAPTISIVMSVYNDGPSVTRALQSLIEQTFGDWECILVDDGSTEETATLLRQTAAREARIRLLRQENQGLTRALVTGCAAAQGEFIARQDADDWSAPTRLAAQLELIRSDSRIGFVSATTQYVGPRDELLELVTRHGSPAELTQRLLDDRQGPPAHGSVMFRRDLYLTCGGYRPEFYLGQDSDLWLRMADRAWFASHPDVLYYWRRSPTGLSGRTAELQYQYGELGRSCSSARRTNQSEQPYLEAARLLTEAVRASKVQVKHARSIAASAYLIGSALEMQNRKTARQYYRQAIAADPTHWRAWVRWLASYVR